MRRSTASWLSCMSSETTRPSPTACGHRQQQRGHEGRDQRDLGDPAGAQDREERVLAQRPHGGGDQDGGQGGHHDLADQAGQRDQDDGHPQACEDRRPAAPGSGRDAERGLARRSRRRAGRGREPDNRLPMPCATKLRFVLGAGAVGVGRGLRHSCALDQHQRRHRQGSRHQARPRGRTDSGRYGEWQALRDLADIADQRDGGGAHDRHDHAGDDQSHERGVRRDPGAPEPDQGDQSRRLRRPAWPAGSRPGMGHEVPELGRARTAPSTCAPTRSGIWPKMMLSATPVRKPIITPRLRPAPSTPRAGRPPG